MELVLFSESTVGEFYERVVSERAERRIFNLPAEDLCAGSVREHVDSIITMFCPGRLLLDPELFESAGNQPEGQSWNLHMWLEFTGPARLFHLRPRQHYTVAPLATRLQPPGGGVPGCVIIQKAIVSASDVTEYRRFAEQQFRAIRDCVQWVNDDLDYYEQGLRGWLWSLLETKRKRICSEFHTDIPERRH